MSIIRFAVVTQTDYPELRDLCDKNFPRTYKSYLLMVEGYAESATALQMTKQVVRIDPKQLRKWLNGRTATSSDLVRYAYYVHDRMMKMHKTVPDDCIRPPPIRQNEELAEPETPPPSVC